MDSPQDLHDRARQRIACRLLPFIFFLYLTAMIDRFNVSFAALRMKADLGFSDSVYGLGASLFFVTYVLFEIPGAVIAERWSVRKWTARIMLSWGVITILTACIHNTREFCAARLLLGAAEASFFPGIIIYLTRWFTFKDRAHAIAAFYTAAPISAFVDSAVAGWLLPVHWIGLSGWRWLFIVEGVPAVVLGTITLVYLTDYPADEEPKQSDAISSEMWLTVKSIRPASSTEQIALDHALSEFSLLAQRRLIRLSQSTTGLPNVLWCVLLVRGALTIVSACMLGMQEEKLQVLQVFSLSLLLSLALVAIADIHRPFQGLIRLRAHAFQGARKHER